MGDYAGGWVVAVTKPQQEAWAAENVRRQGFLAYYPRFQEEYLDRRRRKVLTRERCLFPRYLFVNTDGPWIFLLGTFGVVGVVRKGEVPAVMPEVEIANMQARENEIGLITLPPPPSPTIYERGQQVKVVYGPFTGVMGICQGDNAKERVRILLDFLGRKSSVLVQRDALIAA